LAGDGEAVVFFRKPLPVFLDYLSDEYAPQYRRCDCQTLDHDYLLVMALPVRMLQYGGIPAQFHVRGMLGTPIRNEHREDLWNYFYRGIAAFALAAKAFGNEHLFTSIKTFADYFSSIEDGILPIKLSSEVLSSTPIIFDDRFRFGKNQR
jgi:hypothetical protein